MAKFFNNKKQQAKEQEEMDQSDSDFVALEEGGLPVAVVGTVAQGTYNDNNNNEEGSFHSCQTLAEAEVVIEVQPPARPAPTSAENATSNTNTPIRYASPSSNASSSLQPQPPTITNHDVDDDDSSSSSSGSSSSSDDDSSTTRRRHLWERLPVATPIFDAEVEVWEYQRPTYKKRWGFGFYGRQQSTNTDDQEDDRPPRDPIFTQEDYSNPFRCLGKALGIVIAMPFYLIYFLFCRMDVWMHALCTTLDFVVFRPLGYLLDLLVTLVAYLFWGVYVVVLAPLYTIVVYLIRIFQHLVLGLLKYGILIPIELIALYLILPIIRFLHRYILQPIWLAITTTSSFTYNQLLLPCCLGIRHAAEMIWLATALSCQRIYHNLSNCCLAIHETLLLPCGQAISNVCQTIYKTILLPCATGIWKGMTWVVTGIWKGLTCVATTIRDSIVFVCYNLIWQGIVMPAYNGFTSGIKWSYKHCLKPLGKGLYKCGTVCVAGIGLGMYWMYQNMIVPLGKLLYQCIVEPIVWVSKNFYRSILIPIGQGIMAGIRFLKDTIRHIYDTILLPIGRGIRGVFQSISRGMRSIFRSLRDMMRSVAAVFRDAIRSIGRFFR